MCETVLRRHYRDALVGGDNVVRRRTLRASSHVLHDAPNARGAALEGVAGRNAIPIALLHLTRDAAAARRLGLVAPGAVVLAVPLVDRVARRCGRCEGGKDKAQQSQATEDRQRAEARGVHVEFSRSRLVSRETERELRSE